MIAKYIACTGLGIQDALEYRANFFLSMISIVFPVFVQLFLWFNLFAGNTVERMFGYTFPQMLAYVLYSNIISRLIRTGFEYEINRDIKDGALSVFIVKPASYFFYRLSFFVGKKLFHTLSILILLAGVMIFLFFSYSLAATPAHIALFVISLLLSFLINFAVFFAIGMLCFWFQEIGFLFEAVRVVIIVFSGGVFPLDIFGDFWKGILSHMPFAYTVYFPTDLLSGRLSIMEALTGISIEALWVVVISFIATRLFSTGLKRFSATGG